MAEPSYRVFRNVVYFVGELNQGPVPSVHVRSVRPRPSTPVHARPSRPSTSTSVQSSILQFGGEVVKLSILLYTVNFMHDVNYNIYDRSIE